MKSTFKRSLVAVATMAVIAPAANATNGYFAHGYGTKNKAMAGAGVAMPQDSLAAATNPAGMVWVGNRMDIGMAIFSPRRETTEHNPATPTMANPFAGGFVLPGNYESDSEYFPVPHFGRNWMLGSDSSFGVAVYGNGGMNTDYPSPGPWAGQTRPDSGVDLAQVFITPTYSQKLSSSSSWGIAPIIAIQAFEAKGLDAFENFSTDSSKLHSNGHDISYGAGLRVGWQGEVSPGLTLGASATSRIYMSEFDDYAGLFAEDGDFDIPAMATVGLSFKPTPMSAVNFDVQHIWYSQVDSVANSVTNFQNCPALAGMAPDENCFGGSNGPGFGWDDMTIFKLGYQQEAGNGWTWRAGVSYGEQPITETTLNILAPAVMEVHVTGGFTKEIGKDQELNLSFMYAPSEEVRNTSQLNTMAGPFPDDIELEMTQFEVEASWGWRF